MNMPLKYIQFPSISTRLIAFWIDTALLCLCICLLLLTGLLGSSAAFVASRLPWDKRVLTIPMDILSILLPILVPAYFCVFNGFYGKTPGKAIMGIRIIDLDGKNPGILKAFLRFCLSFFSLILCFLGFIWMFFNRERRTLHDILCRTVVVYEKDLFLDRGSEIA